jgi:hypothetical protein
VDGHDDDEMMMYAAFLLKSCGVSVVMNLGDGEFMGITRVTYVPVCS